jgi:hypothetical protein
MSSWSTPSWTWICQVYLISHLTEIRVPGEVLLGVLPRVLESWTKDVLYWLVLTIKHLNLLPPNMAGAFQKALRQMVSALKKDEALLSGLPLYADTVLHLQRSLLVHIVMGIEILEGTLIGMSLCIHRFVKLDFLKSCWSWLVIFVFEEIQATEVILSARHHDVFAAHQGAAVPGSFSLNLHHPSMQKLSTYNNNNTII